MRRDFTKRPQRRRALKTRPVDEFKEVTPEQVIRDLLQLFERVGIDASNYIALSSKRKNVKQEPKHTQPNIPAIGELLTSWHHKLDYLDEAGNPVPIKFHGPKKSFVRLARESVPNINASILLAELERLGAVSVDRSNFITVHMRSLPVYEDKRLAIQHTLTTLAGFIKTLHHNLDCAPSNSNQLFHRIAWSGEFDVKHIPALKVRIKRHGQHFLESFDHWLGLKSLRKASAVNHRKESRTQVSIGVYLSVV